MKDQIIQQALEDIHQTLRGAAIGELPRLKENLRAELEGKALWEQIIILVQEAFIIGYLRAKQQERE